jgi:hypothetical protein
MRPRAISAIAWVSASTPSAMWTVPARRTGSASHGIGPLRAHATRTVPWSYWKRAIAACSLLGSGTSASRAR